MNRPVFTITAWCPLCGNDLRLRHARKGNSFIGCSSFPSCRYTCDYHEALDIAGRHHEAEMKVLQMMLRGKTDRVTAGSIEAANRKVKELIFRFHPDRAGESVSSHDVTAYLNEVRGCLK